MGEIHDDLREVMGLLGNIVPPQKPLPDLLLATYHEARGWNACREAMLALIRQHGPALLARQEGEDAANYRWLRENLLWSKCYDGYVRWTVEINMPEPGIHEGHPPLAETLDAAIQAARSGGGG